MTDRGIRIATLILAVGPVVSAFINAGQYTIVTNSRGVAYRMNRLTGEVCFVSGSSPIVGPIREVPQSSLTATPEETP